MKSEQNKPISQIIIDRRLEHGDTPELIGREKCFRFNIFSPNFKIGLFCFCKEVEIPYLSASLTYITSQIDTASTNAAYGRNYHLSQFNESDDDLTINLNNLTREYKDNNAKTIIEGTKSPFIFYYDKITNLAAYCYPVGTQRGVK